MSTVWMYSKEQEIRSINKTMSIPHPAHKWTYCQELGNMLLMYVCYELGPFVLKLEFFLRANILHHKHPVYWFPLITWHYYEVLTWTPIRMHNSVQWCLPIVPTSSAQCPPFQQDVTAICNSLCSLHAVQLLSSLPFRCQWLTFLQHLKLP